MKGKLKRAGGTNAIALQEAQSWPRGRERVARIIARPGDKSRVRAQGADGVLWALTRFAGAVEREEMTWSQHDRA
jgi:hypothetical protein